MTVYLSFGVCCATLTLCDTHSVTENNFEMEMAHTPKHDSSNINFKCYFTLTCRSVSFPVCTFTLDLTFAFLEIHSIMFNNNNAS